MFSLSTARLTRIVASEQAVNLLRKWIHSLSYPIEILIDRRKKVEIKTGSRTKPRPISMLSPVGGESVGLLCSADAAEQISLNKKHRFFGANVIKFLRHFPKYLACIYYNHLPSHL